MWRYGLHAGMCLVSSVTSLWLEGISQWELFELFHMWSSNHVYRVGPAKKNHAFITLNFDTYFLYYNWDGRSWLYPGSLHSYCRYGGRWYDNTSSMPRILPIHGHARAEVYVFGGGITHHASATGFEVQEYEVGWGTWGILYYIILHYIILLGRRDYCFRKAEPGRVWKCLSTCLLWIKHFV